MTSFMSFVEYTALQGLKPELIFHLHDTDGASKYFQFVALDHISFR